MKLINLTKKILLVILILTLSGCATEAYRNTSADVDKTRQQIKIREQMAQHQRSPVVVKSGFYVNPKPMSLQETPSWLKRKLVLRAHNLPFNILIRRLLRNSNITVSYDEAALHNRPITMNYRGTVQGALDSLASQLHYAYQLQNHQLIWSAFVTKTFDIAFMPGESNYLVGQSADNTTQSQPTYGGGNNINHLNDDQYSNMRGKVSVWRDLTDSLNGLKSKEGRVIVSQSTSTVTVHDHPQNVAMMTRYIKQLNKTLSQEIGLRVQVLEVQLDSDQTSGINWGAIANTLGTNFRFTAGFATAANLTQSVVRSSSASNAANFIIGNPDGVHTLIQALSNQGKVRSITRPQVVTLNDQIASIRITRETGYIQSVSTSFFGSNGNASTSITPGNVTEGFTLYILPKVQGQKVYMQITSSLSNLLRLNKEDTCPDNNCGTGGQNQQYNAIEVPTTAEKFFNQRSVITSGKTLVIAGYKNLRDEVKESGLFGVSALGGKSMTRSNTETVVLITPTILKTTG